METPMSPRAPVSLLSIPLRPVNSNRQYVKGFIQTSIKDTERPERFLDFGEDGTSGYISKFGQIIQLCKMVLTEDKDHPYRYTTVEPRSIQVDFRSAEPNDYDPETLFPKWKWKEHRDKEIGRLTNDSTAYGLGIRIDKETLEYSNLIAGYRNDRFPEIRYSLDGELQTDVQVNFVAKDGKAAQQFTLTSKSPEVQEIPLLVDLSLALTDAPNERIYLNDWNEIERPAETCSPSNVEGRKEWIFQNSSHLVSAALFCDGRKLELDLVDEDEDSVSGKSTIYGAMLHKQVVSLKPGQVKTFTLIFHQGVRKDSEKELASYFNVTEEMEIPDGMWWQFASEDASIFYRRNLESILSLAAHFPAEKLYIFPSGVSAKPISFHNQSVFDTWSDQRDVWDQLSTLIAMYEVLEIDGIASASVVKFHQDRIRNAVFGHLVFLATIIPDDYFKDINRYAWDGTSDAEYVRYLNRITKKRKGEERKQDASETNTVKSKAADAHGGVNTHLSNSRPQTRRGDENEEARIVGANNKGEVADGVADEDGDAEQSVKPDYEFKAWQFSVYSALFGFLHSSLRVFPDETQHMLRNDLRNGIQDAWTAFKKGRNERSRLYYSDTENFLSEYRDQYIDLEIYTLATQVRAWKVLKMMAEIHPLIYEPESSEREDPDEEDHLDAEGFREYVFSEFIVSKPASESNNSAPKPRFLTSRWGEETSSRLDWYDTILLISQENEYFFYADGTVHPAWIETLEKADRSFPNMPRVSGALTSWLYSVRSDSIAGTLNGSRKAAEVLFSKSSVNCLITGQEGEEPAYSYVKQALLLDYPEISKHILEPVNFNLGRRFHRKKFGRHGGQLDRTGLVKKGNAKAKVDIDKLTPKDWERVNNPPEFGAYWYYPAPDFLTNQPPEALKDIENFAHAINTEIAESSWVRDLTSLWKGAKFHGDAQKITEYLQNQQFTDTSFFDSDMCAYRKDNEKQWGGNWEEIGVELLKVLAQNREEVGMKKLYIIIENFKVETVLPVLYSLVNAPAELQAMIQFFNLVMDTDTHRMSFSDYTLLPDNLWITEFNINFIALLDPRNDRGGLKHVDGYAPKKRSRFVSANPGKPKEELPILTDISFGYRFVGDLHDRVWTGYKIVDSGAVSWETQYKRTEVTPRYAAKFLTWQQRKVLEIDILIDALTLVYHETENIMDRMDDEEQDYEDKSLSEPLLPPVLSANDLTGPKYYSTMHKHSTYYPWVLQCCNVLKGKLAGVDDMTQRWLSAEKHRAHTPRWSEKDQAENREIIRKNMDKLRRARRELELLSRRIDTKIDSVTTLKQSLEAELGLREARTSTQQATSIGLFTVVTVVFLPLSFATSILSIDLGWEDPVKSLHLLMWPTTIGTVIFLLNLPVIYGYFLEISTVAQDWLRRRMADEKSWDFWRQKAQTLTEAEKRTMLMRDDQLHETETNWWYFNFLLCYIFISLPVRQLHTVYQVIRLRPVKDTGILKKLFCLLLSPIWLITLAIVYLFLLAYCIISSSSRGIFAAYIYLWSGPEYLKKLKEQEKADKEARVALYQAQNASKVLLYGEGWQDEETHANDVAIKKLKRKRGPLLLRPVRMMKLKLITDLPTTKSDEESIAERKQKEKQMSMRAGSRPGTLRPGTAQTAAKTASTHVPSVKPPSIRSNGSAAGKDIGKTPLHHSDSVKEET